MAIVVLARHGRTRANADGVLAGWTPGVGLDDRGREQAGRLGARLADVPLVALVTSPLQRCLQTADAIAMRQPAMEPRTDDRWGECRYGAWTGRPLADLAKEPLWRAVQDRPSTVTFPDGRGFAAESMRAMQDRAVAALEDWDTRVEAAHGAGAVWAVVTHGDVLKAVVAHAVGTDLDRFQRIVIDPGSITVLRLTRNRPVVLRVNDGCGDPVDLGAVSRAAAEQASHKDPGPGGEVAEGDADVGGGAGGP